MTDREKAIVMARTGICMLKEEKFGIFYQYLEELFGRPVFTHELPMLEKEIKARSNDDFIELCRSEDRSEEGKWICSDDLYETAICSCCGWDSTDPWGHIKTWFKYCPNCGARMREGGQDERQENDIP